MSSFEFDLTGIPSDKKDLDAYEVEHNFQSWSYQPAQSPLRVVSAKGVRFTTEDGKERLDFSSCFVSHNIGHQEPRVIGAIPAGLMRPASLPCGHERFDQPAGLFLTLKP